MYINTNYMGINEYNKGKNRLCIGDSNYNEMN
jgi:hypothetical protein